MDRRPGALAGRRIVELGDGPALACGRLLADFGAEVSSIEPPGGGAFRHRPPFFEDVPDPDRSLTHWYYNGDKTGWAIDLAQPAGRTALIDLLAASDAFVTDRPIADLAALGLDPESLRARLPGLVYTAIAPFGLTGPRAGERGGDLIALAAGGMLQITGEPDQPPVRLAGEPSVTLGGVYGAIGTLAAIAGRAAHGQGSLVDVSLQEAIAASFVDAGITLYQMSRVVPRRLGTRHAVLTPFIALPCADGYFHWGAIDVHQWHALLDWLAESGVDVADLRDPAYHTAMKRLALVDLFEVLLTDFGANRTKAELYTENQRRRIPGTPVSTLADLRANAQLIDRGFYGDLEVPVAGRAISHPGSPFRLSATPARRERPAPPLDRSVAPAVPAPAPARPADPPPPRPGLDPRRPLAGLRVADFTWAAAGPVCARLLAALGAEVIRVESGTKPDVIRLVGRNPNRAGSFINLNVGKRSISLDLTRPAGRDLAKRLIAVSDVVLENFSPRVMPGLGLGYPEVRAIRPDIVMASIPGQGATGPHRDYVSYGPNLVSLAGFTHLTGHPGGRPTGIGFGFPDYLGGTHATVAVLAALEHRRQTGEGQHLEVSQFEVAAAALGPALLDFTANGRDPGRPGNAHPTAVPHDVYPSAGEDRWIAIAVETDADWPALARIIGRPEWAEDPAYATAAGRRSRIAAIDAAIAAWTRDRSAAEAAERLQAAGVPAAAVADVVDLLERDAHLAARGFYQLLDLAEGDSLWVDGVPFRFGTDPIRFDRDSPSLGEGNEAIFGDLLGLTPAEIAAHEATGAIDRDRLTAVRQRRTS